MSKRKSTSVARLLCSAMFLSLAILLPFLTSQIPTFGRSLCPMHIPVILCGFICGPTWGAAVGATAPLLRSWLFGAPVFMPDAVAMALELAVYAFIAGSLYKKLDKNYFMFYVALITAMVGGRIAWAAVKFVLIFAGMSGGTVSLDFVWASTVLSSLPGIVLQLLLIPPIVNVMRKNRMVLN